MKTLRLLVVVALALVCLSVHAETWRFVVTGDDRQDGNHPRPEDKNGVNQVIAGEIANAVVKEKAKFLVFTGDLVYGPRTDEGLRQQLLFWRSIFQPVYDAHIPILACRGNHEMHSPHSADVWRDVFSGPYSMPQDGPSDEKDLTYTYSRGPVTVISLDEYSVAKEKVNQPWLDGVLASRHGKILFAFGHEMAFFAGNHEDGLMAHPADRDAMITSLIRAHAVAFLCGHDHFYDHQEIEAADGSGKIQQYVAGTAGAPPVGASQEVPQPRGWKVTRIKHYPEDFGNSNPSFGYTVVEVNGNTVTLTYKERVGPNLFAAREVNRYTVP